jgi:hypothetical protein
MAEIESLYRKADGKILIEIDLTSVEQIFNSFDHAPFHEKELDPAAEQYIVDIVDDFPLKTPFHLIIYLPVCIHCKDHSDKIPAAIRAHFRYRMIEQDLKFRARFRYGRWAFLVGLIFVAAMMVLRQFLYGASDSTHIVPQIIADVLLIIAWAAMWEPVTVLLYELWPLIQQKRIYEKISRMEIEVRPSQETSAPDQGQVRS